MTLADEIVAYAAYLNALPRATVEYDKEALAEFKEDFQKAKDAIEVAWLEAQLRV